MFLGASFFYCIPRIIPLNLSKSYTMVKVALITGSAVRIGRELACHLAANGWNLALHFNSSKREIMLLENELRSVYPNQCFKVFRADLGMIDQVSMLVKQVIERMGSLDLLINNASVFVPGSLKFLTNNQLISHNMINYITPVILIRDFANSSANGLIINIADTRITTNRSDYMAYSLSKKGVWDLTKMAALELGPNFRVNAIAPGAVLPPVGKNRMYLEKIAGNTPMKVPPGVISILKTVDYMIDNQDLTGQIIYCDGGSHLM